MGRRAATAKLLHLYQVCIGLTPYIWRVGSNIHIYRCQRSSFAVAVRVPHLAIRYTLPKFHPIYADYGEYGDDGYHEELYDGLYNEMYDEYLYNALLRKQRRNERMQRRWNRYNY